MWNLKSSEVVNTAGGIFLPVVRTWGVILMIWTCEYWTSIKIEITMTCVSKKYEIKTKMVQGVTTAKNDVFIGL